MCLFNFIPEPSCSRTRRRVENYIRLAQENRPIAKTSNPQNLRRLPTTWPKPVRAVPLADAYLPAGTDRKDPQVSPLYADLKGLPPTLIQVGAAETLLADATRFAAAAGAANVPVTMEIWPHMIHAWHLWNAHLEPGRQALANAGTFVRECL
jgi:acetyl esterase/lipase